MSRYSGRTVRTVDGYRDPYGLPADQRTGRDVRRVEAAERNARTPVERTARFRRDRAVVQAVVLEAKQRRGLSGKAES